MIKVSARQKISRMLTLKVLQPKVTFSKKQGTNVNSRNKDIKPYFKCQCLMRVFVSFTRFQVKILGSDEIHVKEGSDVSLRCAITNTAQVVFSPPIVRCFLATLVALHFTPVSE